jgi:hypothetical protein
MQPIQASDQSAAHATVMRDPSDTPATARPSPAPPVGPLGGIVFSALCLATYLAVVVAVAMS